MATTVEVNDSSCGFKTLIAVTKLSDNQLSISIKSDCNNIKELASGLGATLNYLDVIKPFKENVVYQRATENIQSCVVCSVPCATIKALWAELGMTVRRDAKIHFTP